MPRLIEFQGRQIEVPDDATDAEVAQILDGGQASSQSAQPQPQAAPPSVGRRLQIGTQGVGAGMADIAGAPVDLVTGAMNLGISGINKVAGTEISPITKPFGGSEFIRDTASSGMTAVGVPPVEEAAMRPNEKLGYNINRYGTQALGTALPLSMGAAARFGSGPRPPRLGDAFMRPYIDNPSRTVVGDVGGGVGAGAAITAANEYLPEEYKGPIADMLATLAGGAAGATLSQAGYNVGRGVHGVGQRAFDSEIGRKAQETGAGAYMRQKGGFEKPLPDAFRDPVTNELPSRGVVRKSAMMVQDLAANSPGQTARAIDDNAAYYRDRNLPVPTTGLISEDVGMQSAEAAARTKGGVPFIQRDRRLKGAATDLVDSVKDPTANQGRVAATVEARPGELAAARDADAIPLLRQAEAAGVTVDATPVAAAIDQKLASAKRPPVRVALTEARKMLNKVGTDELDDSVAGLYEARKAINDVIEGRGENSTGRFAKKELIEVRTALDEAITKASPEFGEYLTKFREGSEPLDVFRESSVGAKILGDDPRSVAKTVLTDKYGGPGKMAEVNKLIAHDPETAKAWKAAVAEVISDDVKGLTQTPGATPGSSPQFQVDLSKLDRLFKDKEATLVAAGFSPEDMSKLRQAHALLEPLKNATQRATGGSNTADKFEQVWRLTEAGLKARYGVLKGGGILRTMKIAMQTLPSDVDAIQGFVTRAWFDPEIASTLLRMDANPVKGPGQNKKLLGGIAAAAGARKSSEDETTP